MSKEGSLWYRQRVKNYPTKSDPPPPKKRKKRGKGRTGKPRPQDEKYRVPYR